MVFKDPGDWLEATPDTLTGPRKALVSTLDVHRPAAPDSGDDLVKRVIGVGGDHVVCCDDKGRITVNGVAIDESQYLDAGTPRARRPSTSPSRPTTSG